jgi:hypothetical protein
VAVPLRYGASAYDTLRYDTLRYDTLRYDTASPTITITKKDIALYRDALFLLLKY